MKFCGRLYIYIYINIIIELNLSKSNIVREKQFDEKSLSLFFYRKQRDVGIACVTHAQKCGKELKYQMINRKRCNNQVQARDRNDIRLTIMARA